MAIPLSDLNRDLIKTMDQLQPTGFGNPQAVFVTLDVEVRSARAVGRDQSHLKLTIGKGRETFDCIGFRLGDWADRLPPRIDVMYIFELNEYYGRETPQLNLRDLRPSTK